MPFVIVYLDPSMIDRRAAAVTLEAEPASLCWLPAEAVTGEQIETALCRSGQAMEELKTRPDLLALLDQKQQALIRRIWTIYDSYTPR